MKMYLVCLLLLNSSIGAMMPGEIAVAQAKTSTVTKGSSLTKTISPAAALERLIVAPKLEASWFTPEFLKAVGDVSTIQFQRDLSLKLGSMRYGNYKSVQFVKGDKYRIIFDRAEPDAVIAKFQIDASGRIAGIGLVEKNKPEPNAQAQIAAESAIDKSFKNDLGSNGKYSSLLASIKQWLGNYQKVRKVDASNYLGIFDRGSVPIVVNFRPDGSIENYGMGCPSTKSISLNQAPAELQKTLSKCPNLNKS